MTPDRGHHLSRSSAGLCPLHGDAVLPGSCILHLAAGAELAALIWRTTSRVQTAGAHLTYMVLT